MNETIVIDQIRGVSVNQDKYFNEINALIHLKNGLILLYNNVRPTEKKIEEEDKGSTIISWGRDPCIPASLFLNLPCFFHSYGTSICNYARLTGFIVGREIGEITDADIQNPSNKKVIRGFCDDYMDSLAELKEVKKWRDKVSAHFALTDPRKDDNVATLEASIIYPVGLQNSRFKTGVMVYEKINGESSIASEIPAWSLTETFELLTKRFWPDVNFQN
jgi:hypothetical protein